MIQLIHRAGRFVMLSLVFVAVVSSADDRPTTSSFECRKGDRICIIGNTLADRMQHDGWLETYLHARFPKHDFVIRNLGFSGDELTLRLRSESFGSPDQWLSKCQADVVFAFFGHNESFGGNEGLEKFKKDLDAFIKHILAQKYNGKSVPRLVLFSPIAHEDHRSPNLPDGRENNARLVVYTAAMADIAFANKVPFVDLFHPTNELYGKARTPLTINGIHLTEQGNQRLAQIIDQGLFGSSKAMLPGNAMEVIRKAVIEKNHYWFNRYRTVDGYSIYGGRADLKFVDGQTNREVMHREMEVLDVMTANRDRRIWAIAATGGKVSPEVDDSNTPPFIPVVTNKPGPLSGGKHVFLSGEEAIGKMTVAKGMKVNLFADEKQFSELVNPVQMSWDPQGRLWIAVWPTYPHWKPKEAMNDKLLVLEDTDGDGKADQCTTFADGLHCPTGFELYNGGVLIAQAPDIMFLKDTDGDGKADVSQRVLHGMCSADTHHTSNSFVLDPGGALYFQEGTFHHTQVETPYGPTVRCANAGVFRYEPRTQKFAVYVPFGFANPHGHVFDRWGQDIVVDGTGSQPYHAALFSGYLDFPRKHAGPPQVYQQRTRPCPGMEYLSSRHFPESMQGNLLVANVIGFQGILQYKVADNGASFIGSEVDPILSSTDPNFRPSDLKVGPDGALYFIDWHNPIIGHMQHNLRDPSRDREHGRIYRVTFEGRPLLKSPKIAAEPVEKLLDLLKSPEDRVRYRVRIELGARKTDDVISAAKQWLAALDSRDPDYAHHVLEGLWLYQSHNVVDVELLKRLLGSPEFRARAAATRVLCYWRDRVPGALDVLKSLAGDSHPRVRLEAIRAASFFRVPEAVEVVLIASEKPIDVYLDFVRGETLKALDPFVKQAIATRKPIHFTSPAGKRYFARTVSTEDLIQMERDETVYAELLCRKGIRDELRREAAIAVAKSNHTDEAGAFLHAVRTFGIGSDRPALEDSVVIDLMRLMIDRGAKSLLSHRAELEKLSQESARPIMREMALVALSEADGGSDKVWTSATKRALGLRDLLAAMPMIRDPGHRASLYPRVLPLLDGLPKELTEQSSKSVFGRFVRVELPGKQRTLTLAEVEVNSTGRNVAKQGKASQINTAHGGDARRAIDGNTSGSYGDGGQTHTKEGTDNAWWEVDLGEEMPIDSVVIHNRTEGNFGTRLNNYAMKVLDTKRNVVFEKAEQPAPKTKAEIQVGGASSEIVLRHAAMRALTSVRGKETDTFNALMQFVRREADRSAVFESLARIPVSSWPKEQAKPLLDTVLAFVRSVSVQERSKPAVREALQVADAAASLLPPTEAKGVRKELSDLGVRVIRIGTVPDQMLYDQERIVVKSGRPVEIELVNTDLMPHNLAVLQPGSLEEIGNMAEATSTSPDAPARHYVPKSPHIIIASKLLQPRESQVLSFTAPTQPGIYPYVCTYPGHWRRMYGAMYVVDDLDEYLADADAYVVKHRVVAVDPLLKTIRSRVEWRFDELASTVGGLKNGRSFANGKQMFQVASCVSCHKLNGVGLEFGPDLAKLEPKLQTPIEVLRELIDPSHRINEKFQTQVLGTSSGKIITGLVIEETPEAVKIIENPLVKADPVVLKKSEIAERAKSPTSIMPKGLLDKLTREEILDLIAYVVAAGDPKHPLFQGGHDHGHKSH